MPKIYSDAEKEDIRNRLRAAAGECMMKYGVKKTTVDELVRIAGIPKGTFYLFYESKELLLFEVIMVLHKEIEDELAGNVCKIAGELTPDNLTDVIMISMKRVCESCLLRIMTSSDIEVLSQKLPPEVLAEHVESDENDLGRILEMFPVKPEVNMEVMSGAFRGIFFAMIYKREIGEKNFYESIRCMVKGIVIQLFV